MGWFRKVQDEKKAEGAKVPIGAETEGPAPAPDALPPGVRLMPPAGGAATAPVSEAKPPAGGRLYYAQIEAAKEKWAETFARKCVPPVPPTWGSDLSPTGRADALEARRQLEEEHAAFVGRRNEVTRLMEAAQARLKEVSNRLGAGGATAEELAKAAGEAEAAERAFRAAPSAAVFENRLRVARAAAPGEEALRVEAGALAREIERADGRLRSAESNLERARIEEIWRRERAAKADCEARLAAMRARLAAIEATLEREDGK